MNSGKMQEFNKLTFFKQFVVNKLNYEQLEDLVIYFSTSIIEKETEEEILWDLVKTCISKLGFEDCVIYLLDENNELHQKAAHGPKNPKGFDIYEPIAIKLGEGITGTVAKTRKAEIVTNTSEDPRYIIDDQMRLSEIAVPIMAGDKLLGVIDSEHSEPNFFNEYHLKLLNAFASICGIKLLNVRKEKALSEEQEKLFQIERELIDLRVKALKSQMNPHFIFNALNAIQFFITRNDKKSALKYLSTFSKLLRQYLDHLDKEYIGLEAELRILKGYLLLQQLRYGDKLEFMVEADEELFQYFIPSLVIQLSVEDIVERNILQNTGKGWLQVYFEKQNSAQLKVTITMSANQINQSERDMSQSYRIDKISWDQHIDMLNKLKNAHIEKNISVKVNGDEITTKFELIVPLKTDDN